MASPEARLAPVGALRGGLFLLVVGALMVWDPVDAVPQWVGMTAVIVGGFLVAIAWGIRTLRA